MRHVTVVIAAALVASACASGPPPLTSEEMQVRTVTDASECEFIGSDQAHRMGNRLSLQDDAKRTAHQAGGDSYKILHTRDGYSEIFGRTTEAEIEIYRCRN